MFWILFFIFIMVFVMIGGVANGIATEAKGEFDNDDDGITWLVIAIIICCVIFM